MNLQTEENSKKEIISKMLSKEEAINILISMNRDLVIHTFSLYIRGMRSFSEMNRAGILFRSILYFEKRNRNIPMKEEEMKFIKKSMWRETLKEMRRAILADGSEGVCYGGLEMDIFCSYTKLFEIRRNDFEAFPIIDSWNKFRIYFNKNLQLVLMDNDSVCHILDPMTQIVTTKLYFAILVGRTISIYTDEPWNDKYLIFRKSFEQNASINFKLVETIHGLILVEIFEMSRSIFLNRHFLIDAATKKAKALDLEITCKEYICDGNIVDETIHYGSTFILKTTTILGTVIDSQIIKYNGKLVPTSSKIKHCEYLSTTSMVGYDLINKWHSDVESFLLDKEGCVIKEIKTVNPLFGSHPFSNGFFDFFHVCKKKIDTDTYLVTVVDTVGDEPVMKVKIKSKGAILPIKENISICSTNSFITRRNNGVGYYIWVQSEENE